MTDHPTRFRALMQELKRRKVYNVAAGYAAASFVVWQAAEIAFPALGVPDGALRFVVLGTVLGFPVAIALAWAFELRREAASPGWRGVAGHGRLLWLSLGATTVVAGGLLLWLLGPGAPVPETGLRIAVFPLSTVPDDGSNLGEGIADLLSAGLDGTAGLTTVDPQALWPPLLRAGILPRAEVSVNRFSAESRRFGASHYLVGSVVRTGDIAQVVVRLYESGSDESFALLRVSGSTDQLAALVDQVAVDVVGALWQDSDVPAVGRVDQLATSSPQALDAYLEAMAQVRRGRFAEASEAIERAVAADSTFALAYLQQSRIRSWVLSLNGQAMTGVSEIIDRAMALRGRLTPRNRLRVEALKAMDETDAAQAASLLEQILQIDDADADAWASLAFLEGRYAWLLRKAWPETRKTVERALELDAESIPMVYLIGLHDVYAGDFAGAQAAASRMEAIDDQAPLTRGFAAGLGMLSTPEERLDSVIRGIADGEPTTVIAALRLTRATSLDRAERLVDFLRDSASQNTIRAVGLGAGLQLAVARGRLGEVEEAVHDGRASPALRLRLQRYLVATALIGAGDSLAARRASSELARWAPPDSLAWAVEQRDEGWAAGWAAGAYHAAFGDTAIAAAYRAAFDSLPEGGNPSTWAEAIAWDLQARLEARRSHQDEALAAARNAFGLWSIHNPDEGGWHPEPAMRFHLAQRLDAVGRSDEAAWYYRSFLPPHWVSFYTEAARRRLSED